MQTVETIVVKPNLRKIKIKNLGQISEKVRFLSIGRRTSSLLVVFMATLRSRTVRLLITAPFQHGAARKRKKAVLTKQLNIFGLIGCVVHVVTISSLTNTLIVFNLSYI